MEEKGQERLILALDVENLEEGRLCLGFSGRAAIHKNRTSALCKGGLPLLE